MENEDFLEKTPTSHISSPCFSYTPKRTSVQKSTGTPLSAIEENSSGNEDGRTPAFANPFDIKSEAFSFPVCSPSIFATLSKNSTDKHSTFRWSIEHLSVLFPADIDETSIPDSWTDPDQELKAQKAIDAFFSQNSIVPSPWSPSSPGGGGKIKMRRTIRRSSQANSFTSTDVSTQTKLTIPPTVDLEALLGEYFTYQEDNNISCSSKKSSPKEFENMNTSSLRRRLFGAKEETFTPKWCKNNSSSDMAWCTPNLQIHDVNTPASDVLSSSPISQRNSSDCYSVLPVDCLDFSPISAPKHRSGISRSGLRMSAFNERIDEESSSSSDKSSFHSVSPPPESMSFSADLQESIAFPSYSSKEQDTGYATGSMSSSQNAISSLGNGGTLSRITPVTELMEDCGISRSDMSIDGVAVCSEPMKQIDAASNNLNTWPWFPTNCSTPAMTYNA